MKNKIVYGSDKDDFIWKMETVYNPIEKLHLKLAKWHLRKVLKVSEKDMDELYDSVYEALMRESIEEIHMTRSLLQKLMQRIYLII
jgi:hypothetical protein